MLRYLLFVLALIIVLIASVPLLSAQEAHPAAPQAQIATPTPIQLVPNLPVSGTVSQFAPEQVYSITALLSCPLQVIVTSDLPESGPRLVLENSLTGEVLALLGPQLVEGTFTIPPSGLTATLRVYHSGSTFDEPFTLFLQDVCQLEDKDRVTTGACTLTAFRNYPVNVRALPRVDSNLVTTLPPETSVSVLRRTDDNQWWEVNIQGQVGWVSRSVSERSGDCTAITSIPSIRPTSTPTPPATYTYTPSVTYDGPTYTPSATVDGPTYTPSATYDGPTYTPSATYDGPTYTPSPTVETPTHTPTDTPLPTETPAS